MYYEKAMRNANKLLSEIFYNIDISTLTDEQKAKRVFIELAKKLKYEESLVGIDEGGYIIDGINEVLECGNGICNRFAAAYKFLMNILKIQCRLMVNQEHAHNQVFLSNKWISCDITTFSAMLNLAGADIDFNENCDILPFFDMSFRKLQSRDYHGAIELDDEQFELALQERDGVEGRICRLNSQIALRVFRNENIISIEAYQDIEEAIRKTLKWIEWMNTLDKDERFEETVQIRIDEFCFFPCISRDEAKKKSLSSDEIEILRNRTRELDDRVEAIRSNIAIREFVKSPAWTEFETYMEKNRKQFQGQLRLVDNKLKQTSIGEEELQ